MKKTTYLLFIIFFMLSCKKDKEPENPISTFKNILILGNSITLHPQLPSIGWYGNWGMAASSREKDFVHILASKLKATVKPVSISGWENAHSTFNLSRLNPFFNEETDLIIIRLGENVKDTTDLKSSFLNLVNYVQSRNSNAKLMITGKFWKDDVIDLILSNVANEKSIPFVKLSQLDLGENVSHLGAIVVGEDGGLHEITDQGVANHPGDAGMEKIADCIYKELNKTYLQ